MDCRPGTDLAIEGTTDPALNRHSTAIFLPTTTTGVKGLRCHDRAVPTSDDCADSTADDCTDHTSGDLTDPTANDHADSIADAYAVSTADGHAVSTADDLADFTAEDHAVSAADDCTDSTDNQVYEPATAPRSTDRPRPEHMVNAAVSVGRGVMIRAGSGAGSLVIWL